MKNPSGLSSNFLTSFTSGGLKIDCNHEPMINFKSKKDSRILDIIDMPIKLSKKTWFN